MHLDEQDHRLRVVGEQRRQRPAGATGAPLEDSIVIRSHGSCGRASPCSTGRAVSARLPSDNGSCGGRGVSATDDRRSRAKQPGGNRVVGGVVCAQCLIKIRCAVTVKSGTVSSRSLHRTLAIFMRWGQQLAEAQGSKEAVCRGAWARVTIDELGLLAPQAC